MYHGEPYILCLTMFSLIQACEGSKNLELEKWILGCVNGLGIISNILVLTSLVHMYSKLGKFDTNSNILVSLMLVPI